jgi:hypothetical protein
MQGWIDRLHQWRLGEFAATLLEAAEPLNLIAAQFVYISQPMLKGLIPTENMTAFATMLEDPKETSIFVARLRENT